MEDKLYAQVNFRDSDFERTARMTERQVASWNADYARLNAPYVWIPAVPFYQAILAGTEKVFTDPLHKRAIEIVILLASESSEPICPLTELSREEVQELLDTSPKIEMGMGGAG